MFLKTPLEVFGMVINIHLGGTVKDFIFRCKTLEENRLHHNYNSSLYLQSIKVLLPNLVNDQRGRV